MLGLALFTLGISAVTALLPQNSIGSDCPLAGPDFPPPRNLSGSPLLADAINKFEALLADKSLGLRANDTALAVAFFSAKEDKVLYESYFTPPMNVGVAAVDRDSVFRLGSVSKVFTVWTLLIHAGDALFNHPITEYVPELAKAANASGLGHDVVYDDINNVRVSTFLFFHHDGANYDCHSGRM